MDENGYLDKGFQKEMKKYFLEGGNGVRFLPRR